MYTLKKVQFAEFGNGCLAYKTYLQASVMSWRLQFEATSTQLNQSVDSQAIPAVFDGSNVKRWFTYVCRHYQTIVRALLIRAVATGGISAYIPPNQSTLNFLCGCFVSLQ